MSDSERLIELIAPTRGTSPSEVTLYVKGFLGRNEEADDFAAWSERHRRLVAQHGWAPDALGWTWESGSIARVPIPLLSGMKFGWDVYRTVRGLGRMTVLGASGASGAFVAEQAAVLAFRFVRQYLAAATAAQTHALELGEQLERLALRYERVRIVAHSLGCVQVLEAASRMETQKRPHEIHLCAPACLEDDVAPKLSDLAQERSFLYYTANDLVLEAAFRLIARGRALGAVGPQNPYPGLEAFDVSDSFEFFVHTEYKNRLDTLVQRAGRESAPACS